MSISHLRFLLFLRLIPHRVPPDTTGGIGTALSPDSFATDGVTLPQNRHSYNYIGRDNAANTNSIVPTPSPRLDRSNERPNHSRSLSESSSSDHDVDAMGCVDDWTLRGGLLDTSSGASFTRQITKEVDGIDTSKGGRKGSHSIKSTAKRLRLHRKRDREGDTSELELVLPQRKVADHLFEVYWAYSDVVFPWLDEAEVRQQYASLWLPNDGCDADEKVLYCTLNLMFAIAAKLDPSSKPETRKKSANTYYKRARDLLSFNLLDISHFEIRQNLLLAAQYLQSTNMPRQCFQTIGLAIWVAQDLGLHLPETTCLLKDPLEQESARRVWHGCILMDKYYNRPWKTVQTLTLTE